MALTITSELIHLFLSDNYTGLFALLSQTNPRHTRQMFAGVGVALCFYKTNTVIVTIVTTTTATPITIFILAVAN